MKKITVEQMTNVANQIGICMRVFAVFAPNNKMDKESFFSLINGGYGAVCVGSGQGSYWGQGELSAMYDPETQKVYFTLTEPVGMSDNERHDVIPDHWRWRLFSSLRKIQSAVPEAEVYAVPADVIRRTNERVREKIAKAPETPPSSFKARMWDYPRLISNAQRAAEGMMCEINSGRADRFGEYEYFFRKAMEQPLRAILDFEECYSGVRDWKMEGRRLELNRYLTQHAASLIRKLAAANYRRKDIVRIWEGMQGFWDETTTESSAVRATVLAAYEAEVGERADTAAFFQRPEYLLDTLEYQQYLKIVGVDQDAVLRKVAPKLIDAFAKRITEDLVSAERNLKNKNTEEAIVVANLSEDAPAELAEVRAMYQRRVDSAKASIVAIPHDAAVRFERIKEFCASRNLINEGTISQRLREIEESFAAFQTAVASA